MRRVNPVRAVKPGVAKRVNSEKWRQMLNEVFRGDTGRLKRARQVIHKHKKAIKVTAIVIVVAMVCHVTNGYAVQDTLYQNKVPITVKLSGSATETGRVDIDQSVDEYAVVASISDISPLADAKVNGAKKNILNYSNKSGRIKINATGLREGDNKYILQIIDGKRKLEKTVVIHRQTKVELSMKKAEEKRKKQIEEEKKKAEEEKKKQAELEKKSDLSTLF